MQRVPHSTHVEIEVSSSRAPRGMAGGRLNRPSAFSSPVPLEPMRVTEHRWGPGGLSESEPRASTAGPRRAPLPALAGPYRASTRDVALGAVFVACAFVLSALLGPVINA